MLQVFHRAKNVGQKLHLRAMKINFMRRFADVVLATVLLAPTFAQAVEPVDVDTNASDILDSQAINIQVRYLSATLPHPDPCGM